ncbi:carboxyl transferase domain protein [Perkinsela sp. CCAP 1560/4]|nr:carboxyl transferase domain protein [Perkinsela sp. CCAP 1560/4]|eukprot:KNH06582.1 carboxyl transferase domain protein [Perkinsela sp. CCAP 1560/4]
MRSVLQFLFRQIEHVSTKPKRMMKKLVTPVAIRTIQTSSVSTFRPPQISLYNIQSASASSFHQIESVIDHNSTSFHENFERSTQLVADLKKRCLHAASPPKTPAFEKYCSAGKLPVDHRISSVLDNGSAFLELSQLAGLDMYEKVSHRAEDKTVNCGYDDCRRGGIVTGIGTVMGSLCVIIANDATVKGGAYYPITVKKHLRAQRIAMDNRIPVMYLVDSAGANLLMQAEIFPDECHFGKIFHNQARMSAMKIPQLAVVLGSCTAGGAYIPCMCDETIIVRRNGTIFLGGPALVAAATGEVVDAQSLGGADVHCRVSGVADHYAEDEASALELAREIAGRWGNTPRQTSPPMDLEEIRPRYRSDRIYGILPPLTTAIAKPFDVREILACLLDKSEFTEFKPLYDENLVCGFGALYGNPVAIIANNGVLLSESARKGAHFIQLCCARKRPILFIQNITGFMIGKKYEQEGIAKHGAMMVHAVANAAVPKITLIIGGSYGAGNYAMCGRAFHARFVFSWPGSRTAVMSGQHASDVMCRIARKQVETSSYKQEIIKKYDTESHYYYSSARLWDDGVIDPAETREILGLALAACLHAPIEDTVNGVMRM